LELAFDILGVDVCSPESNWFVMPNYSTHQQIVYVQ
jgi:hypothetical protein